MQNKLKFFFLLNFVLASGGAYSAANEAIVLGSECDVNPLQAPELPENPTPEEKSRYAQFSGLTQKEKEKRERLKWDFSNSQKDMTDGLRKNGWNVKSNFISSTTVGGGQLTTPEQTKDWMKRELRKSFCDSGADQLMIAFNAHGSGFNPATGKQDHSICLFAPKVTNAHSSPNDPTRLYMSEVNQWIKEWKDNDPTCKSKPKIAVVDRSCHSGGATEQLGDLACVMTSTTDASATSGSHGLFQSISSLLQNPTDSNKANALNPDNKLTMDEAYLYTLLNPGPGASLIKNQPQLSGCTDKVMLAAPGETPTCQYYVSENSDLKFVSDKLFPAMEKYENDETRTLLGGMCSTPLPSVAEIQTRIGKEQQTAKANDDKFADLASGEELNLMILDRELKLPSNSYNVPINFTQAGIDPKDNDCFSSISEAIKKEMGITTNSYWRMSGNKVVEFGVLDSPDWDRFGTNLILKGSKAPGSKCTEENAKSMGPKLGNYLNKQNEAKFNETFAYSSSVRTNMIQAKARHAQLKAIAPQSYNNLLREARAYGYMKCVKSPNPAMKKCQDFNLKGL